MILTGMQAIVTPVVAKLAEAITSAGQVSDNLNHCE
jgi:hypothetical protein